MASKVRTLSELERLLTLTSPPMRGEAVRELQQMLRHNPFGIFDPGRDDGVYDEQTAAATRRAWYWLGSPESRIGEKADELLYALLAGERALPVAWKATRTRRLRRAEETLLWDEALSIARE